MRVHDHHYVQTIFVEGCNNVFGTVQCLGPNWLLEHLFPISEARIGVNWGEIYVVVSGCPEVQNGLGANWLRIITPDFQFVRRVLKRRRSCT